MNGYHIAWLAVILLGTFTKDIFVTNTGVYNYGFIIGCLSVALLTLAKGEM